MDKRIDSRHPRLLVEWERRGRSFLDAVGPALSRSPRHLETERGYTGIPGRAVFASTLFQCALVVISAALLPILLPALPSFTVPPDTRVYKFTYLPSLAPTLDDSSGAEEGTSGAAGGRTAFHPVQAIRIARGAVQVPIVYQPPALALPRATSGLMNLLVIPATPVVPLPEVVDVRVKSRVATPSQFEVVPPPPRAESLAALHPKLLLPEAVPPPPIIGPISARPRELPVEVAAPATKTDLPLAVAGLSGARDAGFLFSATPGNIAGAPPEARPGTLAMAPDGNGAIGAGGSGGGAGTGKGAGPGSGAVGNGPGSSGADTGYGADKLAHGGTAAGPNAGGSGNGGSSAAVGVTVRGGPPAQPGVIYLSSFAPPQVSGGLPAEVSSDAHVPLGPRHKPAITIVATPTSGGGIAAYGALRGQRVYTTYLETAAGLVVLQYADSTSNEPGFDGDLISPDPLNLTLPDALPVARFIVACTIDRSGVLRAFRVLEASDTNLASRILAAITTWRFRPALRRDTPIEVSAIFAFHVGMH